MTGTKVLKTTLTSNAQGFGLEVVTLEGESLPVIRRVIEGRVAALDGVLQNGDRLVAVREPCPLVDWLAQCVRARRGGGGDGGLTFAFHRSTACPWLGSRTTR